MHYFVRIAFVSVIFLGGLLAGCDQPARNSTACSPGRSEQPAGKENAGFAVVANLPPEAKDWGDAKRVQWITDHLNSDNPRSKEIPVEAKTGWATLDATVSWFKKHWDVVAAQLTGLGIGIVAQYALGSVGIAVGGTAFAIPTMVICAIGGAIVSGYLYVYDVGKDSYSPSE